MAPQRACGSTGPWVSRKLAPSLDPRIESMPRAAGAREGSYTCPRSPRSPNHQGPPIELPFFLHSAHVCTHPLTHIFFSFCHLRERANRYSETDKIQKEGERQGKGSTVIGCLPANVCWLLGAPPSLRLLLMLWPCLHLLCWLPLLPGFEMLAFSGAAS